MSEIPFVGQFDARHSWQFYDDFIGGGAFGAASAFDPWVITDTSSAGAPTYTRVDIGESTATGASGAAQLAFDSQDESQIITLSFGDLLAFDIDKLDGFMCRVSMGQAAVAATTDFAFGVTGDRNDAIDSIAIASLFRVVGGTSTTAVVAESDDGSANNDDKATGTTLINAWKLFYIDFRDVTDVLYYIDGVPVATATTFDMSNYDAGLQPFFQLQKTGGAQTDFAQIDYVFAWGVR
ncbi:MAG TPA: hypothetical protein VLA12_10450 [Planctomycetaceae bacterium]|nr:hypothetical protein [Planctomycetaceae bacterium]